MGSHLHPSDYVVSYDALKTWIYDQEEYARRTGEPAPLTSEQIQAIAILVPPTPSPPPTALLTQAGGNMLEIDYVSLLMRYVQARKGAMTPPEYIDEQLPASSLGSPQWRTRCRLPREAPDQWFPDVNEPRPQDSIFQNKKASRRHAARCAVEWLIAVGHMSSDGQCIAPGTKSVTAVAFARTTVINADTTHALPVARGPLSLMDSSAGPFASPSTKETSKPLVVEQSVPLSNSSSATPENTILRVQQENQAAPSPSPRVQSMATWKGKSYTSTDTWEPVMAAAESGVRAVNNVGNSSGRSNAPGSHFQSDSRDYEGMTKVQLLDSLCKMLKLGSPSYMLTPVSEYTQGIFNGHIVFPPAGTKGDGMVPVLPEGVGAVHNVFTKRAAKERIAESVLQYLEEKMSSSVKAI
ncbi:hypothetical protein SEUCBS139899_005354 [Sporothrix eucalyptigena]|uniref:DRBM domain-containing protein n=1 Tax=Sporothrix eucalyptigena TaxID=1812306 RepID=A0ABP0BM53_9PEZI